MVTRLNEFVNNLNEGSGYWNVKTKDAIESVIIDFVASIGRRLPDNYEDLTQDIYESIGETNEPIKWTKNDVINRLGRMKWEYDDGGWSKTYNFHLDKDGDIVWEIPYNGKLEDLVKIDDEKFQDFLCSEISSGEGMETKDKVNIYWGSDVQDLI